MDCTRNLDKAHIRRSTTRSRGFTIESVNEEGSKPDLDEGRWSSIDSKPKTPLNQSLTHLPVEIWNYIWELTYWVSGFLDLDAGTTPECRHISTLQYPIPRYLRRKFRLQVMNLRLVCKSWDR